MSAVVALLASDTPEGALAVLALVGGVLAVSAGWMRLTRTRK